MEVWKSVALHTIEMALVLVVAFVALKIFNVSNELVVDAVALVLAAAVKWMRTSDDGPVSDYVNSKLPKSKKPVT